MSVFSVPVTIGVNEEEIARNIEQNVEKQVVDKITNEIKEIIFEKRSYYGSQYTNDPLRCMVKKQIADILEENRDIIVNTAANILAEKLARSKAVREVAGETAKEVYKPVWVKAKEEKEGQ